MLIRILIRTTVVPIRVVIGVRIRILIGSTVVRIASAEVLYYPCSKNKGADRYRKADLRLFFAYAKNRFSQDAAHFKTTIKFTFSRTFVDQSPADQALVAITICSRFAYSHFDSSRFAYDLSHFAYSRFASSKNVHLSRFTYSFKVNKDPGMLLF